VLSLRGASRCDLSERYHPDVIIPRVKPQLVANIGLRALDAAIADPDRWAIERKVDGVRSLIVYQRSGAV
jgi:hypothetical protein